MKKYIFIGILPFLVSQITYSQTINPIKQSKWTNHFQLTFISQKHSGFKAAYSGDKSLADSVEPSASSITTTLFLGRKLWKGAAFYFNSEISGDKGLSFASGVAGALNGETYRIGAVEPAIFIARAYLQQNIPLRHNYLRRCASRRKPSK